MIRGSRILLVASTLALAGRYAIGCAASEDIPSGPSALDDGSVVPPLDQASASDASRDGDASIDAAPPTCSADGWCYTTLPAKGSFDASAITVDDPWLTFSLRAVWVAPDHRAWAVSDQGHVLLWDGTEWQVKAVLSDKLRSVWGPSSTEVWITGDRGLVMRGIVSGSEVTFQRATLNTTQTMTRIVGTSNSNVWVIADGIEGSGSRNRVFRLNPINGSDAPTFSPMTVPSTLPGPSPSLVLSALWTSGSDFWIAGHETTYIRPTYMENLVAMKWIPGPDGGAAWEKVPFRRDVSNLIIDAMATSDGAHVFVVRGDSSSAIVVRVSDDESKLNAGPNAEDGGITHEGGYAWTQESVADGFGDPAGLWAANQNDVWVVGRTGLVRHFDGTSWKLARTSLTNVTPLLEELYSVHAVVDPSGEQDMWIVGDDVALHRKIKP